MTHLSFTADNKHLVVQTGAPDFALHYVAFDRGTASKVLASMRNVTSASKPIASVECHVTDATLVTIVGRGFIKYIRLTEEALRPVQLNLRRDPVNFTAQAHLPDDRLVLGTNSG